MLKKSKIIIVQATFYQDISKMLLEGAIAKIKENGYDYEVINVPGAFEIPTAIAMIIKSALYKNEVAGYVALGCVIRGETTHYDYVCLESARGINKLAMKHQLPIGMALLPLKIKNKQLQEQILIKRIRAGSLRKPALK